ncbi:efflux RND transporter permease subunit [Sulfuriroseicoccus oceanibius]|uniref:Efflux RND transporter permease subunit n=1 Tax=Sulfuriroseicoccus oceanibius TaxID=2707525 RepID=A0A6B3LDI2_9BACT|nr:efflux RND transporter permease subunit [Sulfuriroseicoccus oceanibius]QQL45743.1 efflux RND transporter permease subunit [Sulfuriroseicoccus oceanibius]
MSAILRFCLENKLVVGIVAALFVFVGVLFAPFAWDEMKIARDPVPVDAIPDYGANQQIVFTQWEGRSPKDVDDQITYPLTVALMGLPHVETVRSYSYFGYSTIFVIFKDDADFYWSRSRLLEKLSSLPSGTLPQAVSPMLGPDATGLGQVFWYTLEGRTPDGKPAPGWDPQELRSIQDWTVRYALQGADDVAEVASVGGFVKEYQIDVDPDALRHFDVSIEQVFSAVRSSNIDVGARTIELNRVEYIVRGIGRIDNLDDVRSIVVAERDNIPVTVEQLASVELGPAMRRGALDKDGSPTVGGVVVSRFGANPMQVIDNVKDKIAEIAPSLPKKVLEDGTVSQVTIVPFYDRSSLIKQTLGTLEDALIHEVLITIIVVVVMVMHIRSSLLISSVLPLAVLGTFIAMKFAGVDANVVALSGIAIAIGTVVDVGIVLCENILSHVKTAPDDERRIDTVFRATKEVSGAVATAVATTVVSFLPVFSLAGAEGKLFKPLAYTKTFALVASIVVSLALIPPLFHLLLGKRRSSGSSRWRRRSGLALLGLALLMSPLIFEAMAWWMAALLAVLCWFNAVRDLLPERISRHGLLVTNLMLAAGVAVYLAGAWHPLGVDHGFGNVVFTLLVVGGTLALMIGFTKIYPTLLAFVLRWRVVFWVLCLVVLSMSLLVPLGARATLGFLPDRVLEGRIVSKVDEWFPGLSSEFMPKLDEGSFLLMPTTSAHASIGEAIEIISLQDAAISAIPEVETVVGKIGRVESALDPAPVSMVETVINYKPEFKEDADGRVMRFAWDKSTSEFVRDASGELVADPKGRPFRNWRDEIKSPDDIWEEIVHAAKVPGVTDAPKLQPIETRIVMLQSGMRAPIGMKVFGPDLESIEKAALQIEQILRSGEAAAINTAAVSADRVVGKPYIEIDIKAEAIQRYGLQKEAVQRTIEVAVGGRSVTTTIEGRERYPVRVRYPRERRGDFGALDKVLVATPSGAQIPLGQLATISYRRGPQMIKSEDTFLVGYVILDTNPGFSEIDAVNQAQALLDEKEESGEFVRPPGVTYVFTGNYENQVRFKENLVRILPVTLALIFLLIFIQFRKVWLTAVVFTGVAFALSGGFVMIWLYGQEWFLAGSWFGVDLRSLFQMQTINLSVAIWVGFLALFGIATDDGVLMSAYLEQRFNSDPPRDKDSVRRATIEAATRRIRPAMMTSATTVLALLPVLSSTGKGADIMVPMAIPTFGGMVFALITVFVVPTIYCTVKEKGVREIE